MTVEIKETAEAGALELHVSGTLTQADYEHFVPVVERLIEASGKIRILFQMHDFHGWKAAALWEDIKFGARHFRDVERIAMVGDKAWEHGMALFCKPFTGATIKYFDSSDADAARVWFQADTKR